MPSPLLPGLNVIESPGRESARGQVKNKQKGSYRLPTIWGQTMQTTVHRATRGLIVGLLGAVGISFLATDVAAQQGDLEEVVVTARKREEALMDVPLSITAITELELERQNVYAMEDLAQWTPALQFQDVNGAFQNPAIRGLNQTDQTSPQGNVGVFLDGVSLSNRSGLEFGMLDVARIEVVKGPQSALYGRNTFAGAINYVTKAPTLGETEGRIEATVGTEERFALSGSVNLPLGENAAIRLFGGISEFDGTISNVRDGSKLGGYDDRDAFGVTLLFEPTDSTRITLFGLSSETNMNGPALALSDVTDNNCGSPTVNPSGVPRMTLFCGDHELVTQVNLSEGSKGLNGETKLYYGKLEQDFAIGTLTVLASTMDSEYSLQIDTASNPNAINIPLFIPGLSVQSLIDASTPRGDADTIEIRLSSNEDNRFSWTVGAFSFDSVDIDTLAVYFLPLGDPNGEPVLFFARDRFVDTQELAAFVSGSYDFSDQWTATLELRHTEEELKLIDFPGEQLNFRNTVPKLTVDYRASDDLMFYGSVGQGVKAGNFNTNVGPDSPARSYDEESNWSYELGVKATLLDGRLVTTGAIWYVDWEDVQVQTAVANSPVSAVQNFGAAESTGFEVDATFSATDNFTLRGTLAVLNPEYKNGFIDGEVVAACGEFVNTIITEPGCTASVGGNQISRTSDFQFSISGNYDIPQIFGNFDGYVRVDYSHESGKFDTGLNYANQGDISLANARFGIVNDRMEIALWVDNIFDEKWNRRVTSVPFTAEGAPASGVVQYRVYPGDLLTAGVDVRFNF